MLACAETASEKRGCARGSLRVFDYEACGDGVLFLRSSAPISRALIPQLNRVHWLVSARPLIPRLVVAASGFSGELQLGERDDLALLLSLVSRSWCHWLACTNLERLTSTRQRDVIDLFDRLGAQVYISDDDLANPLPAICEHCETTRADVRTVGLWALCTACSEQLDCDQLLSDLILARWKMDGRDRVREEDVF